MFEELKKKALKSSLVLTVVFFIAGAVMVGLMATNMFYIVTGYADFTQLAPEEIKNQLVEYDMEYNFGCCIEEYEYNEDTHRSKTTALYYIIWTGDDEVEDFRYMAVKVPANYETKMEKMAGNSYNYLPSDPISIQGKITKFEDEEYEYFLEFFEDADWSESDIAEGTLPYYINVFDNPSSSNAGFIFLFSLGVFFLAWAIIRIVKACTGGYLKKLKKDIEKAGLNEASVESDYARAATFGPKCAIRVGRLMTYFMLGSDARAIPNDKIAWAYMNTITHRTNGIKTGTTYNVQIETEGAGSFAIGVDKEAMAIDVLKKMNEMLPWVVVGYSDELKALYRKNRAEFLNIRYNTCEHVAVEPGFEGFESTAASTFTE